MTISAAQFAAFLADSGKQKVVLAEMKFAHESAGNVAEGTVYLSMGKYATRQTDSPPNQPYRNRIKKLPTITRSITAARPEDDDRRSDVAVSVMELANDDGALDFLLKKIVDGREIAFYVGAPEGTPGWSRADFRRVALVVMERINGSRDGRTLYVELRDKRLLLNHEIQGDQVGGSGPESTTYLPLLFGSQFNVEAKIYDATTNEYAFCSNSAATATVQVVRDGGLSLTKPAVSVGSVMLPLISVNAGTDLFTLAGHTLAANDVVWFSRGAGGPQVANAPFAGMTAGQRYWVIASGLTANDFRLSATKGGATIDVTGATYSGGDGDFMNVQRWFHNTTTGRIQLSANPAARVTLDVLVHSAFTTSPFAFAKYLIETYGNVTAGEINAAAFTAADAALDAKITLPFMNFSVYPRENLADVLDRVMAACFGWYGQDASGLITCGLIDVSGIAGATASHELDEADVLEPGLEVENLPPGYARVNIENNLNHTVQGDGLLAGVGPEDLRIYASPYRSVGRSAAPSGTAYATNKPLYHKTMAEGGPVRQVDFTTNQYGNDVPILFGDYPGEIVADQAPMMQLVRGARDVLAHDWDPGDIVAIDYSRYDLGGVNGLLIEHELDLDRLEVRLTMLRQFTPDLTAAN